VQNFEPHTLHSSTNNIRVIKEDEKATGCSSGHEEMSNAYEILTE
jgi:hypothetical protein